MATIILLDFVLTLSVLIFIAGSVWYRLSTHTGLEAHGTDIGAVITQVRRDDIAHQTCVVTAAWTDPRTGRRWTFHGLRRDLGYQPGQLIGIRLDPRHPSRYLM